jgi:hypothetical protein
MSRANLARYGLSAVLALALIMPLMSASAQDGDNKATPDLAASDPQDPFVRGLVRLDEKLRLQREAEELARRALELERKKADGEDGEAAAEVTEDGEIIIPAPLSDPDFFTAFAARKYRLDGLVLSRPDREPAVHIINDGIRDKSVGLFFWSGSERRYVYLPGAEQGLADIAAEFNMQLIDMLQINGVSRAAQLKDKNRIYVSPRDNGPLIHIVQRGDTLNRLAARYKTRAAFLRDRNRVGADNMLTLGRRFLIREKTITPKMAARAVPEPAPVDLARETRPRLPYARLAQYKSERAAKRGAREFYLKYYAFMDSDITLRREKTANQREFFYNMDIGPLRSPAHGEAYCALFRRDELPCLVVNRVPGPERERNFDSQAIISVSPYVYYDGDDVLETGRTDVEKLTKLEYFLTEGKVLGNNEGTIAKITPDRIFITDANGYLLTLPLNKIPEIDPIEKAKREAEARQAALNQAAAAAGAVAAGDGGGDGGEAEGNSGVVKRLQEGEGKRRAGSTDALNKVLGTSID